MHPPKQYVNDRTMGCFSCRSEKYLAHLFGCIQLVDWTGLDWTGILVFASDRHARAKYTLGMRTICMLQARGEISVWAAKWIRVGAQRTIQWLKAVLTVLYVNKSLSHSLSLHRLHLLGLICVCMTQLHAVLIACL